MMNTNVVYYPFETFEIDNLLTGRPFYPVRINSPLFESENGHKSDPLLLSRLGAEVAYWLSSNKAEAFHEPEGRKLSEPDPSRTENWVRSVMENRLFFTNGEKAKEFQSALPGFERQGDLFPKLSVLGEQLKPNESLPLGAVIRFRIGVKGDKLYTNLWMWCRDNLAGRVFVDDRLLVFESADDALMFKLAHAVG